MRQGMFVTWILTFRNLRVFKGDNGLNKLNLIKISLNFIQFKKKTF